MQINKIACFTSEKIFFVSDLWTLIPSDTEVDRQCLL